MLRARFGLPITACVGVSLLLLAGCGPRPGTLSGKVTLDGQPLKGGMITFHSKNGSGDATAEIKDDGTYSTNTFAGEYTVTVDTEYLKPPSSPGMGGRPGMPTGGPPGGSGPRPGGGGPPKETGPPKGVEMPGNPADHGYVQSNPGDSAKKYVKIPAKYGDVSQSGLSYTHPGGSQTYDIPLVSK